MSVSPLAPPASSQPRITLRRTASGSAANRPVSSAGPEPTSASACRASSSSVSVSSRSAVAVRASASATPPPSTSSNSGSTSTRSRVRVNRRSALWGSCHGVRPNSAHAAWVSARRTPNSGRYHGGSHGRMPAIDREPEPRPSPSSTVSAWSSRVWASSTGASRRASSIAPYRAVRAAASGPPAVPTSTQSTWASTHPNDSACSCAFAATSPESGCSRWSTISAVVGLQAAATAVSASESAPPDSATHQRSSPEAWSLTNPATAAFSAATAPCRSIAAAHRFLLAAAGFRHLTRRR